MTTEAPMLTTAVRLLLEKTHPRSKFHYSRYDAGVCKQMPMPKLLQSIFELPRPLEGVTAPDPRAATRLQSFPIPRLPPHVDRRVHLCHRHLDAGV